MTTILMLPLMAAKILGELIFGTTEAELRIMEQKARAQLLMNKGF